MESVSSVNLLDNKLKIISKHETRLNNTSKFDPYTTKLDQVHSNLVSNATAINNRVLDSIVAEKSDIDIPPLVNIYSTENDEETVMSCRVVGKRKIFAEFNEYVKSKCGDVRLGYQELSRLMMDAMGSYYQKQQQATTITFKGKTKLRTFVLKQFARISKEIDNNSSHLFKSHELKKIIYDALDKPDDRTVRAYLESLKNYAKYNKGMYASYEYLYNMRGFKDTVSRLLEERGLL